MSLHSHRTWVWVGVGRFNDRRPTRAHYYLEWTLPDLTLLGELRVTDLEIRTGLTDERAFAAVIEARLRSSLEDMASLVRAPTFPVHDVPWEDAA